MSFKLQIVERNLFFTYLEKRTLKWALLILVYVEIKKDWLKNKAALFPSDKVKTIPTFSRNQTCVQKTIEHMQGQKKIMLLRQSA